MNNLFYIAQLILSAQNLCNCYAICIPILATITRFHSLDNCHEKYKLTAKKNLLVVLLTGTVAQLVECTTVNQRVSP